MSQCTETPIRRAQVNRLQNELLREIEQGIDEFRKKWEWISKAQSLTPFITVTEADYVKYGHLTPEEWLIVGEEMRSEDDYLWELQQVELDFEEDYYCEEDYYYDREFEFDDLDDIFGPTELEFGGRFYPKQHVEAAVQYLKGANDGH